MPPHGSGSLIPGGEVFLFYRAGKSALSIRLALKQSSSAIKGRLGSESPGAAKVKAVDITNGVAVD
jgi:hypothetical protein